MRSLYTKLMIIFIVVVIIGFAGMTYGLTYYIEDYFYEKNLETMAGHVVTFQKVVDSYSGFFLPSQQYLSEELSKLEEYSSASVWLISSTGDIYFNVQDEILDLLYSEIDFEEVQQVFSGQTLIRKSNYAALDNKQYITMIRPITVFGDISYALYINTEVAGLNESAREVKAMALIALAFTTTLLSLMTLWVTRNIRSTLKKFNSAIRYVSKGNYEYTLDEDRNDEFGELAKEFNAMSQELKNVDGMRRKFVSDISHDLRSPLTSIKGFTQGMLDGTIPKESHERYLQIVLKESERLSELTEDILDLSRLQSGDASLDCQPMNLNAKIEEILATYQQRIEDKNLFVNLNLEHELDPVRADVPKMERVIGNLIDNAVKFAEDGGTVSITTLARGDKVLVSFANSGAFIPKEKLSSIWMRFSKLDESRGSVKQSSGLGLAIVKEILELHGETIDVYSEEGKGTTFAFTLRKHKK